MKKKILFILVLSLLIPSTIALASGNFSYVTIDGPGLTDELNITDPALTSDFFIFADFTKGPIDPPAAPGEGYEVTRVYIETVDNKPEAKAFDQLLYFPYTDDGYVYYVGVSESTSEYDGKWFAANPAADEPFRAALAKSARLEWIPLAVLGAILAGFYIAYRRKPKTAQ